jgi:hypothetical protein
MVPIELKIIITTIALWLITHLAAYPSTSFSKWGEKKFKSYGNFIGTILFVYCVPIVITGLYWLWSL